MEYISQDDIMTLPYDDGDEFQDDIETTTYVDPADFDLDAFDRYQGTQPRRPFAPVSTRTRSRIAPVSTRTRGRKRKSSYE